MKSLTYDKLYNKWIINAFIASGLFLDSLFHIYRFYLVGWTNIKGLWGQDQSILLSFMLSPLVWILLVLTPITKRLITRWWPSTILLSLVYLVVNQVSGRSTLKFLFDVLFICVFLGWLLINSIYGKYLIERPLRRSLDRVYNELLFVSGILFAVLIFVISIFGFSFAPNYIERYYQQAIAQPTIWWFGVATTYLTLGLIYFVCLYAFFLALHLRSLLERSHR